MSEKIQDQKDQNSDKTKAGELKDEDLKNVVGGGLTGSVGLPGVNIGKPIPKQ